MPILWLGGTFSVFLDLLLALSASYDRKSLANAVLQKLVSNERRHHLLGVVEMGCSKVKRRYTWMFRWKLGSKVIGSVGYNPKEYPIYK